MRPGSLPSKIGRPRKATALETRPPLKAAPRDDGQVGPPTTVLAVDDVEETVVDGAVVDGTVVDGTVVEEAVVGAVVDAAVVGGAVVEGAVLEVVVGSSCSARVVEVGQLGFTVEDEVDEDVTRLAHGSSVVVGPGSVEGASGPGPVLTVDAAVVEGDGADSVRSGAVVGATVAAVVVVVTGSGGVEASVDSVLATVVVVVSITVVTVLSAGAADSSEPGPGVAEPTSLERACIAWSASGPAMAAADSTDKISAKANRDVMADRPVDECVVCGGIVREPCEPKRWTSLADPVLAKVRRTFRHEGGFTHERNHGEWWTLTVGS